MSTIKYFGNKSWADITREERYFCAELFFDIKKNTKGFIYFLNRLFRSNYDIEQYWEVGFEVCFYRDFHYSIGQKVRETEYSDKRTFDLCLFSNKQFIIIEAKADQKFDNEQLTNLKKDIFEIKRLINKEDENVEIKSYLLNSSHREKNVEGFEKFTWFDLYNLFNDNQVFLTADNLPLKQKPKSNK